MNSLERAVLSQLSLPKWFNLTFAGDAASLSLTPDDLMLSIVDGKDARDIAGCEGLPAVEGTDYTVIRVHRELRLRLGGAAVLLSPDETSKICFLLDVCSGGGCSGAGGVAFMVGLPLSIMPSLSQASLLQRLASSGLTVESTRLAVGGKLKVYQYRRPTFWNGDETFEYCYETTNNFYLGGMFRVSLGGGTSLMVDGDVYFNLPGLCGGFVGIMGGKAWSAAAKTKLTLGAQLFGMPLAMSLASADLLVSLGGEGRQPCKRWGEGECASPSGVFVSGDFTTPNPFEGTLIAGLIPEFGGDIQAYLLARQEEVTLPPFVREHFTNKVRIVANKVTALMADITSAVSDIAEVIRSFPVIAAGVKAMLVPDLSPPPPLRGLRFFV